MEILFSTPMACLKEVSERYSKKVPAPLNRQFPERFGRESAIEKYLNRQTQTIIVPNGKYMLVKNCILIKQSPLLSSYLTKSKIEQSLPVTVSRCGHPFYSSKANISSIWTCILNGYHGFVQLELSIFCKIQNLHLSWRATRTATAVSNSITACCPLNIQESTNVQEVPQTYERPPPWSLSRWVNGRNGIHRIVHV